jgi:hypothetical protein
MFTDPQLQIVNGFGWISLDLEQDIFEPMEQVDRDTTQN